MFIAWQEITKRKPSRHTKPLRSRRNFREAEGIVILHRHELHRREPEIVQRNLCLFVHGMRRKSVHCNLFELHNSK